MDKLLGILKDFKFPHTKRSNVLRKGQTGYEGFALGKVNTYSGEQIISRKTKMPKYKELYEASKKLMRDKDPKFRFTSIQYVAERG